ncbi:MAG TPA: hypothetical protein VI913_02220 [Candidatus Peribacteraceae bacterium]|nr:hypothetical protein [Candidatus Peribacteraceae bacterium]
MHQGLSDIKVRALSLLLNERSCFHIGRTSESIRACSRPRFSAGPLDTNPIDPVDLPEDAKNMTPEVNATAFDAHEARVAINKQLHRNHFQETIRLELAQGNHD